MDCFYVGRLTGTQRVVWQHTATDVVSAFTWALLHTTPKNPSARWTSELARAVAKDLAARGWKLETAMTGNASEFRAARFEKTLQQVGPRHAFIHAGRPQTNGCVERVHQTILEAGRGAPRPTPAGELLGLDLPTGRTRDLAAYALGTLR